MVSPWAHISCKCILQTLGQPVYKKSINNMLRKERKWSHIKCSIKTTKGSKRIEDKTGTKRKGKKKKKSNRYDR